MASHKQYSSEQLRHPSSPEPHTADHSYLSLFDRHPPDEATVRGSSQFCVDISFLQLFFASKTLKITEQKSQGKGGGGSEENEEKNQTQSERSH